MQKLKKVPVAIALSLLIVLLSVLLGQVKHREQIDGILSDGNASLDVGSYESWIRDPQSVLSTEERYAACRSLAQWETTYDSEVRLVMLPSMSASQQTAEAQALFSQWQKGDARDALLLLTADGGLALARGEDFFPRWREENIESLRQVYAAALRQGSPAAGVTAALDILGEQFPRQMTREEMPDWIPSGILRLGAFAGVFVALFLGLGWAVPLLVILAIIDRVKFDRFYDRYYGMINPPKSFRPLLFWHGSGTRWFARRWKAATEKVRPKENGQGFQNFQDPWQDDGFHNFRGPGE